MSMTIFDLLFIMVLLAILVMLVMSIVAAMRRRRAAALRILGGLCILAAVYLGVVVLVSVVSPRRVLKVGEDQCFDDWCIAVASVRREPAEAAVSYVVALRVSSRARGRPQRERGLQVYLMDEGGRCYDPIPDPAAGPFDVLLQPQEPVHVSRTFQLPADARDPVLVVSHGGGFPGCCIIGDSDSIFHKRTVVRLD